MDSQGTERINIKGKETSVDACVIDGKTIVVTGRALRIAKIKDEICAEGIQNPGAIVDQLKKERKADIFTFDQKIPDTEPRFPYYFEWDNVAVLHITSVENWWNNQIHNDARRMVRKSEKKNVVMKVVPFTDEFVSGIKGIYDETPIRQGKPFWHYNKDFDQVKKDNSSFLERAEFIGAYCDNELIGFSKLIYTGKRADHIQLLSRLRDRDKAPTNALIAKAVEVCFSRGISYLTYDKYQYGKKSADSLSEFKTRNGFVKMDVPRYYVPLTFKGMIALKLKLHRRLIELLPPVFIDFLIKVRAGIHARRRSGESG